MKNNTVRLPAEWETDSAVLLSWPHADTDWAYMLHDAQKCVAEIARAVTSIGRKVIIIAPESAEIEQALSDISAKGLLTIYPYLANDTWTRDYGPLTLLDAEGNPLCVDYQ
ncbi:MAG: agmatine deiminase family protein, partial [Paramuribaculum sp.]|nr:agmatine deiminase family protein [Paramuribaculum sp.]